MTGRLREMLRERLLERYDPTGFERAAQAVIEHKTDPYVVIEELLGHIDGAPQWTRSTAST